MNPRLIRLRDVPKYLGMDKNRFNAEVRPRLTEVPIGARGIAFDRLELDAWVDDHVRRNGRSVKETPWNDQSCPKASFGERGRMGSTSSTSISKCSIGKGGFAALAERLIREKQSDG
jgi:predicted DNA-binding transcriptional regulator AlpA